MFYGMRACHYGYLEKTCLPALHGLSFVERYPTKYAIYRNTHLNRTKYASQSRLGWRQASCENIAGLEVLCDDPHRKAALARILGVLDEGRNR